MRTGEWIEYFGSEAVRLGKARSGLCCAGMLMSASSMSGLAAFVGLRGELMGVLCVSFLWFAGIIWWRLFELALVDACGSWLMVRSRNGDGTE